MLLLVSLLNKGKNKTIYVYFIKQKLFGYSPSSIALMMENIRKAFAPYNKHILFCFYFYLIWRISL